MNFTFCTPYPFKIKWNNAEKILYIGIRTAWRTVCSSSENRRFKSRLRSGFTASLARTRSAIISRTLRSCQACPSALSLFTVCAQWRRRGRFRAGKILHKTHDARGVSLSDRVKPDQEDPGAACLSCRLPQSLRRGPPGIANDIILYHAACVVNDLAAVLYTAELRVRRGGM